MLCLYIYIYTYMYQSLCGRTCVYREGERHKNCVVANEAKKWAS